MLTFVFALFWPFWATSRFLMNNEIHFFVLQVLCVCSSSIIHFYHIIRRCNDERQTIPLVIHVSFLRNVVYYSTVSSRSKVCSGHDLISNLRVHHSNKLTFAPCKAPYHLTYYSQRMIRMAYNLGQRGRLALRR